MIGWILISFILVYIRWRRGVLGVGLIFSYMLQMWAIHGLGAAIYILPWYEYFEPRIVEIGFQQASYGFIALALGSSLIAPFIIQQLISTSPSPVSYPPEPRLAKIYIAIGLICYLFFLPASSQIPSATAFTAAGWRLTAVGMALILWEAFQKRAWGKFSAGLVGFSFGLPLLTIVVEGFLSFGAMTILSLLAFVGSFFRPRRLVILLGFSIAYLGLSGYVTYMRDRPTIREAVWGGYAWGERTGALSQSFQDWEWLNLRNEDHLQRMDERLNQNVLVGAGVHYLGVGFTEFAGGATVGQAILSLIPRAIWPEKPIYAGSGTLVSDYTGIPFEEGTSVGIGQVLEFYINWGTIGVVLGFLILSIVVAILDWAASQRLQRGDWQGFAYFYLPGLSLIETGGSLVGMISSSAAGLLTIYLVNRYLLYRLRRKSRPLK